MSYLHINNLYKAREILLFRECYALEKVHGTSAHVTWHEGKLDFFAGGASHAQFVALFDVASLTEAFRGNVGEQSCKVFGEAYGGKLMRMAATYGPNLRFVAFEVQIGDCWLAVPQAEEVVTKLGLAFVSYTRIPTDLEQIDAARDAESVQAMRNGMGHKPREGVVLRPLIEVTLNNGARIIAKHKREEFKERAKVPNVTDAAAIKALDDAQAIADEWVVPMRLEHVLQQLPPDRGLEHTGDVIKAMVADVYREAKGEIVEGKAVAAAIGRKTAALWRQRLNASLKRE